MLYLLVFTFSAVGYENDDVYLLMFSLVHCLDVDRHDESLLTSLFSLSEYNGYRSDAMYYLLCLHHH